ncbi:hypothetical protein LguiB_020727 [Lonicera macranthoides]
MERRRNLTGGPAAAWVKGHEMQTRVEDYLTCGDHSCAYLHLLDVLDLFLALYSTCISLEFISFRAKVENPTGGCTTLIVSLQQKVEELQSRVTALKALQSWVTTLKAQLEEEYSSANPSISFAPLGSSSRFLSSAENIAPNIILTTVNLPQPGVAPDILPTTVNLSEHGALPTYPNLSDYQAILEGFSKGSSQVGSATEAACIPSTLSRNNVVVAAEIVSDTLVDQGLSQPHQLCLILCPNVMLFEHVVRMANCVCDDSGGTLLMVITVCGRQLFFWGKICNCELGDLNLELEDSEDVQDDLIMEEEDDSEDDEDIEKSIGGTEDGELLASSQAFYQVYISWPLIHAATGPPNRSHARFRVLHLGDIVPAFGPVYETRVCMNLLKISIASMSCLNFEYGEMWLQEEIKCDSARLTQLEIERRMRLNKAPKKKLKSQPRKVKFKDELDLFVINIRHGGEVGESRVRDNNMAYEQSKKMKTLEPSQSLNTSFGEPNQLKEVEKRAIFKPPLENKPKTNEIEEIEVIAVEGELWVEGVVPSLQKEEDEETLVQVKEPQVQALPVISVDENYIEESQSIPVEGRVDKQETLTIVTLVLLPPKQAYEDQMKLQKESMLKVDEVEHVDFIGVDKYDFHPNHQPGSFFNELWGIELKHHLKFDEFCLSKKAKQQTSKCGLNQTMLSQDSRTNLLEEEGLEHKWIEVIVDTQVDALIEAVNQGFNFKTLNSSTESSQTMVFANTVDAVEAVAEVLMGARIECYHYHTDSSLEESTKALVDFQEKGGVFVCTNAAARGLDIPNVSHVIQAEFASSAVDFMHRVGRTARAG